MATATAERSTASTDETPEAKRARILAELAEIDAQNPQLAPKPQPPDPERRFRVLHAAVGGYHFNKKGQWVDKDYNTGEFVTETQLDGNAAYYVAMGAIEEVR